MARNRLLVVTVDAMMCVAALTRLLTQELAGIFMSLADLVERAYDVWDDGTRCAARSHPGVAHKRRASDSVVTMLDTYDALQWESKDCEGPIGGVAAHGLNIDQYGAGGLTDDHHEIWVLIKKT